MRQNIIQLFKTNQAARAVASKVKAITKVCLTKLRLFDLKSLAEWLSQGKIITGYVQWIMPSKDNFILFNILLFYLNLKGIWSGPHIVGGSKYIFY